jgi:hypothetical protein
MCFGERWLAGSAAVDVLGMLVVTGLEKCFQKMFAFEIVSP